MYSPVSSKTMSWTLVLELAMSPTALRDPLKLTLGTIFGMKFSWIGKFVTISAVP